MTGRKGNAMKTKNIILIIILAAAALGIGLFVRPYNISTQTLSKHRHHEIWYCPMHPWILYDHPGRCPICGMDLVKKGDAPQQQKSEIEGYTRISVTAQRQQLAGVRTALVDKKVTVKTIRTAGEYEGQVYAQVFEDDLEFIKVGQRAIVEVPAYHKKYEGTINSIDSTVDETSRTIRVRIWLQQNNQRRFKNNMFVNVEFPVKLEKAIIVPRGAVLDTGLRKMVFVQKDEGTFEPREIQTGLETDDGFEVKSGLKEGERIVVSGNFLLDSESRVQAGLEQGATHE
jgi:multidrug efflux pump subunit AcrA (membrane-fusion protein)